jgi:hypothetical protein
MKNKKINWDSLQAKANAAIDAAQGAAQKW